MSALICPWLGRSPDTSSGCARKSRPLRLETGDGLADLWPMASDGLHLRAPRPDEADALTELCMRSKAHWGYDAAFMASCRPVLTMTADRIATATMQVAVINGRVAGVAQIDVDPGSASELDKLFVDPDFIGRGVGRALMAWAETTARRAGARSLRIEADPDAEPFYCAMGAKRIGDVPSEAIPGRRLPLLSLPL